MTQRTGYEKFQQQAFDELDELEEAERDRTVARFVELGKHVGLMWRPRFSISESRSRKSLLPSTKNGRIQNKSLPI